MWKCDKCGEMNNDNTTQCERCGSKCPAQPGWKCSRCGETNEESRDQCCKCGCKRSAVKLSPTPNPTPDPIPDPIPDPSYAPLTKLPAEDPAPAEDIGSDVKKKEQAVKQYKAMVIAATLLQLVLFAIKYTNHSGYTIYGACSGEYGGIEQICSILLVVLTIIPPVTVIIPLDVRKRNLPITVSAIIAALTTVYCLVIWFGNSKSTVVPALIILLAWGAVFFAYKYVTALNGIDNTLLHRPTSF